MKKLILILLLMPLMAYAAKWTKVGAGPGSVFYIDKSSVIKSGGGQKAWSLISYDKEKSTPDGKAYTSVKALHLYSCDERTTTLLQEVFYPEALGKGLTVQTFKYEKFSAEDIIPDSITDVALGVVCKK
jgi:hypothetical protein